MRRYHQLLRRRTILVPFAAAVVGRLPLAMAPLGIVVLIEEIRGSYATAGVVSGAFAMCTAASVPLWSAVMDRVGQPRVITGTSSASAIFLSGLALLATAGAGDFVLLLAAGCVGLAFPPISPAIRVAWDTVTSDEERRTAYAMDAVAIETIFVGGPLLLTALLVAPPAVPLLATSAFMGAGGLVYARSHAARSWQPVRRSVGAPRGRSPLMGRRVWPTLLVALGISAGWGQMDVALTASAERVFHSTTLLGVFFACTALGSTFGGLWYGSRTWRRPERLHLPYSLAGFAAGLALVGLALGGGRDLLPLLIVMMLLTGLFISPCNIIQQALVDAHTVPERRSEGQGWLLTALTFGGAAGMSLAGFVTDHAGPRIAFGAASLAVLAGAVLAVAGQRAWRADAVGSAREALVATEG